MDKQQLRLHIKRKRNSLDEESLFLESQKIHQLVLNHSKIKQAKMIACYVNLPYEVETKTLIERLLLNHRICVPKVTDDYMEFYEIHSLNDLEKGYFNVLEPQTHNLILASQIDLMILPLVACDIYNHRLGYGKGFYDRYIAKGYHGYKIGLAFSYQVFDSIPFDTFDQKLDEILTSNVHF